MITIGIDPHKSSLTAIAVTPTALLIWATQWPERQWAVEGATGLGRSIAQQLVTAGELVLDVPAKLAARARLLDPAAHARPTSLTPSR